MALIYQTCIQQTNKKEKKGVCQIKGAHANQCITCSV